jgi:putative PIG3 family NAD(P)H quinone oxidoreductase
LKAIVITRPGGPEVLEIQEVPDPVAGEGELLVRVRATALNRADTLQRRGLYPPPPGATDIMGLEMAGEIAGVGAGCSPEYRLGGRVMALLPGGGYAQYVTIPAEMAMPVPDEVSFEEAAALPEACLTAYMNLFLLGELQQEGSVLVHAAGSGVGSIATQLASAAGATVLATARAQSKVEAALKLGANYGFCTASLSEFSRWVMENTGGKGVDVILDFIGGPYLTENLNSLAINGRLVLIGQMGGSKAEVDLGLVMRRRLHILGTTLRAQPLDRKLDLTARFREFGLPLIEKGLLKPVVDRVYDLAEAGEAHRYMEDNANTGKIVLRVN